MTFIGRLQVTMTHWDLLQHPPRFRQCGVGNIPHLHSTDYDRICRTMERSDENTEAVRNVETVTDSEPVNGEELLGSDDLKRQLREAKERLKSDASAND